jgi:phosphopantothenoylcysteine decarboxylase/phosphopantothenate--cysteine ligase
MNILKDKIILLGITGSIAAYKAPLIIRELIKRGAEVHAIMTPAATEFITELTIANLSRNPVIVDMFDKNAQQGGAWHIHLAQSCDAMIIAPCSAATLGKLANGICDNSLVAVATAKPLHIPLIIAPAMDETMFNHPSTQRNIEIMKSYGALIIPPEAGELSSGLTGFGRLPDIPVIIEFLEDVLKKKSLKLSNEVNEKNESNEGNEVKKSLLKESLTTAYSLQPNSLSLEAALEKPVPSLQDSVDKIMWSTELEITKLKQSMSGKSKDKPLLGKKLLVTAGPTIEKIDDVRFISNFSSGKMGFALAEIGLKLGASVTLITGKVALECSPEIERIDIISSEELYNHVMLHEKQSDIIIMAAAVADYSPVDTFSGKIKKKETGDKLTIELTSTKGILKELGRIKTEKQLLVGFALESKDEVSNGWNKLKSKNCDMLVVNSANKPDSGFGGDMNTITILNKDGSEKSYPAMSKAECAEEILGRVVEKMSEL